MGLAHARGSRGGVLVKRAVTQSAVVRRINRKLAPKYERLCTSRAAVVNELGAHHLIDSWNNSVIATDVDVEEYARELGVLHESEEVAFGSAAPFPCRGSR